MVTETIQYYTENGCKGVYLLILDASKAFDNVVFDRLFNELIKKNVCPKIIKLLLYMYTNQNCDVQWDGAHSNIFRIFNGVKQGSVISPLLFTLYIDSLFLVYFFSFYEKKYLLSYTTSVVRPSVVCGNNFFLR